MISLLFILASYCIGAIPTGYWLGKAWKNIDIRQYGSGNVGATNVFRVLGKGPGLVTLFIDITKGLIPVLFARHFFPSTSEIALAVGIAAIIGHTLSFFIRFRGGKGVATSAGVFAGLAPLPFLLALSVFAATFGITRWVSLSSLSAAMGLGIGTFLFPTALPIRITAWLVTIFIFWTHRANMQRLRLGTEPKLL